MRQTARSLYMYGDRTEFARSKKPITVTYTLCPQKFENITPGKVSYLQKALFSFKENTYFGTKSRD